MTRAPLASCEYGTCGLDDQGRHPGQLATGLQVQMAWAPGSLTVRAPLLDECLPFDGPIDGSVRLDESLRLFVCVLPPLRAFMRARTACPCSRAIFACISSCWRMALASH